MEGKPRVEYFNTINVIKAILYFGEHTKCKLYRTRLQLMLFYYEKEYYQCYGKKILNGVFLYNGYIPELKGLDYLLEKLDSNEIIKIKESDYGKYINTLVCFEESEYDEDELEILTKILNQFDDMTTKQIIDRYLEPELKHGEIKTITETFITYGGIEQLIKSYKLMLTIDKLLQNMQQLVKLCIMLER